MPVKLERKLMREANQHGFKKGTKQYGAYVYGTINKAERGKKRNSYKAKGK